MSEQTVLQDNIDVIKINNTKETLEYNGKTFTGNQASNCAFLIRIALQKFDVQKTKKKRRKSKSQTMLERM